jgi:hypothetical protein
MFSFDLPAQKGALTFPEISHPARPSIFLSLRNAEGGSSLGRIFFRHLIGAATGSLEKWGPDQRKFWPLEDQ